MFEHPIVLNPDKKYKLGVTHLTFSIDIEIYVTFKLEFLIYANLSSSFVKGPQKLYPGRCISGITLLNLLSKVLKMPESVFITPFGKQLKTLMIYSSPLT